MSKARAKRIITLTTDFGTSDHYVAAMKGVILSRCPGVELVDITHEIPPYGILAAAYSIHQAVSWFPRGTVHVVVVDPGVGTARRGLLVDANGQFFVAPDNGVLSFILRDYPGARVYSLTNQKLWLTPTSHTFHGRDVFAPVAAALASGTIRRKETGPRLSEPVRLGNLAPKAKGRREWIGQVLSVDRFGNVITNFPHADFGFIVSSAFEIQAGRRRVNSFYQTFGDAVAERPFAYFGSSGFLELGMNQDSAAVSLQLSPEDSLVLRLVPRSVAPKAARA
jgi:S-adenosyl-L-methionine hydrolase (adenosine-forming)